MSRISYLGVTYLLGVMIAGIVVYLSIVLNQKAKHFDDFSKYVKTVTNKEGLIKTNFRIKDSITVYNFVANEIISTCPDSSMFKTLFLIKRSKSNNLNHFFNFMLTAIYKLPSIITNVNSLNGNIYLTISIPCSKKINIDICFRKLGQEYEILRISGFRDLILHLDLVLKQNY